MHKEIQIAMKLKTEYCEITKSISNYFYWCWLIINQQKKPDAALNKIKQ